MKKLFTLLVANMLIVGGVFAQDSENKDVVFAEHSPEKGMNSQVTRVSPSGKYITGQEDAESGIMLLWNTENNDYQTVNFKGNGQVWHVSDNGTILGQANKLPVIFKVGDEEPTAVDTTGQAYGCTADETILVGIGDYGDGMFVTPKVWRQNGDKYDTEVLDFPNDNEKFENGAFAVIVFDNGGKLETVEIKYSNITVEEVSEIQKSITKVGYDISQWTDNEGNVINADVDYAIPYNQILECNFVPQTYEIYLYASPSVGFDFEIVSQDESGLIKYRTNITYDDNYSFEPTKNPDGKYVFWRMTDGSRISSEGIWRIVAENGAELRADFGYKLNYDLNNENVSPDFEIITEYVFNGSAYELGVPETSDGRRFIGWSLSKNGDSMITDETGRGLSNWTETTSNDYTVYAIWE